MGMYTEFHFNAELKQDTPDEVIHILLYMLNQVEDEPDIPKHDFFKSARWRWMLQSDSYYFAADTHSTLRFDHISQSFYLCIRCNLKNYDSEIDRFIDWIAPYIDCYEGDFLGFKRYEEFNEPELIYALSPREVSIRINE